MDETRHYAILRVEENENPDGRETVRGQITCAEVRVFHRAHMARNVDGRAATAHQAQKAR